MRTVHACRETLNDILSQIEAVNEKKDALPSGTRCHEVGCSPMVLNTNTSLTQSKKRVSAPKRMANPFR